MFGLLKDIFEGISLIFSKDLDKKTLRHLKKTNRKFVEKRTFLRKGHKIDVYVFENKKDGLAGQCVPGVGTIILNKENFKWPKLLQDYYLFHELGHKKTWKWLKIVSSCLLFISIPLLLLALCFLLFTLIGLIFFFFGFGSFFLVASGLATIVLLFPFVFSQWISEGFADSFAIRQMSIEGYLGAHGIRRKIRQKERKGRIKTMGFLSFYVWKIFGLLSYPPEWIVVGIYKKLNK